MYELIYKEVKPKEEYEKISKKVLMECIQEEGLENAKLTITITLTNGNHIKEVNKKYRGIDNITDVLSFPMFEKDELQEKIEKSDFPYEDILGDIIICMEKVEAQAKEYGHSFEREFSYMLVHGFYHLMGYDHIQEEDKKEMRKKEEKVLSSLHISIDNSINKERENRYEK
jgi:probable rRNA maturation factor